MNQVELVGVLIWPVEAWRDRASGQVVGRAVIAVSGGIQGLDFVPLTLRGREAIEAAKYLGDGSRVQVQGHLHSVLVTDRDRRGAMRRRRVLCVIVDRLTYLTVRPPRGVERA